MNKIMVLSLLMLRGVSIHGMIEAPKQEKMKHMEFVRRDQKVIGKFADASKSMEVIMEMDMRVPKVLIRHTRMPGHKADGNSTSLGTYFNVLRNMAKDMVMIEKTEYAHDKKISLQELNPLAPEYLLIFNGKSGLEKLCTFTMN